MKKVILFVAMTLCMCTLAYAKSFKVGVSPDYPPFEYVAGEKYAGVDMDLLAEIAKRAGFEYEIVSIPFNSLEQGIESGNIDLSISALAMTKDRLAKFDFSVPYYSTSNMFICRSDNKKFTSKEDLAGKTIAVINKGSRQERLAKSIPNAKVVSNESIINTMILVKTGRADAMIIDSVNSPVVLNQKFEFLSDTDKASLNFLRQLGGDEKLEIFYLEVGDDSNKGIMFKKGFDSNLLAKINKAISDITADGTMKKILNNYGIVE